MSCINPEYLEKIIIKSLMEDKNFCVLMSSVAEKRYFESSVSSEMFQIIKDHHEKFMDLPNKDIIINSSAKPKEVEKYIKDIEELEPSNDLFLYEQSENWLKESAFKYAIMDSVDLVKKKEDINKAREYIECALTKTLKKQIGLDYWGDISERLKRMFSAENERIPTYYPQLDEFMNGGLPPYTLSVIVAAMHAGKCVSGRTKITVKNIDTKKVEEIDIGEFVSMFLKNTKYNKDPFRDANLLKKFIEKYGEDDGQRRFDLWKSGTLKK